MSTMSKAALLLAGVGIAHGFMTAPGAGLSKMGGAVEGSICPRVRSLSLAQGLRNGGQTRDARPVLGLGMNAAAPGSRADATFGPDPFTVVKVRVLRRPLHEETVTVT